MIDQFYLAKKVTAERVSALLEVHGTVLERYEVSAMVNVDLEKAASLRLYVNGKRGGVKRFREGLQADPALEFLREIPFSARKQGAVFVRNFVMEPA